MQYSFNNQLQNKLFTILNKWHSENIVYEIHEDPNKHHYLANFVFFYSKSYCKKLF